MQFQKQFDAPIPSLRRHQLQRPKGPLQVLPYMLLLAFVWVSSGATCANRQTLREFQPPIVFTQTPTLHEVIAQVNRSLAIERLESNTLTISSEDIITNLKGNIRWERPYNFSLEAYPGTKLMGLALAAGSNDEMFWLQTQIPSPPTLYYARHDEFARQLGPRRILPVSPLWLREAMGVVELDPTLPHDEPIIRSDGKLEVRSYIPYLPSPNPPYRRHLVMDATTGTIEQTLLYNHEGKLIAVAQQSDHQYYAAIDTSLPHLVQIQMQPDDGPPLAFSIEVGFYSINELPADATSFQPPEESGIATVDLVKANAAMSAAAAGSVAPVGQYTELPNYTSQAQPATNATLSTYRGGLVR